MIHENFAYVGAAIALAGGFMYAYSVIKGKAQPNLVTWVIWLLAPLLAFIGMMSDGIAPAGLAMTLSMALGPLIVLIAAFVSKHAQWKTRPFDYMCGGISVVGLVLWMIFRKAEIAIVFAIAAEVFGYVPTLVKSWNNPESESYSAPLTGSVNAAITLLTLKTWTVSTAAFPIYIFVATTLLTFVIVGNLGPKTKLLINHR